VSKIVGTLFVGVLIGAAAVEILRRKKPEILDNIGKTVRDGGLAVAERSRAVVRAVKQGYAEGRRAQPADAGA
jgi:hypothetical protein